MCSGKALSLVRHIQAEQGRVTMGLSILQQSEILSSLPTVRCLSFTPLAILRDHATSKVSTLSKHQFKTSEPAIILAPPNVE
jgi:hypothetical protein